MSSLFDDMPVFPDYDLYGGRPPHEAGSDTSREAAEAVAPTVGTKQRRILDYLTAHPVVGATVGELEDALDMPHTTTSARVRELVLKDLIHETGGTRVWSGSGRSQRIVFIGPDPNPTSPEPVQRCEHCGQTLKETR